MAIMTALLEASWAVLLPFGENTRYDLVIDDGVVLARVQCKTGRLRHGGIRFGAWSSYAHHPNPKMVTRDYLGEIDYFAVYCPDTGGVDLVPVEDAPVRSKGTLRVSAARNGQKRRIRTAADYEIGHVLLRPTAGPGASAGGSGSCA
jgi:hypothetical protein